MKWRTFLIAGSQHAGQDKQTLLRRHGAHAGPREGRREPPVRGRHAGPRPGAPLHAHRRMPLRHGTNCDRAREQRATLSAV